ncbi:hypothetical protein BT96DRAFT_861991 [Gymnopus androsaceus JB14]|uniref:Multicopper oxidase n=1 Tax=Gymnopus androsaceus JB14 TaxID=1447944 RepID=A0A6A4HE65_9AGAR|nr:hypothetical protein BT96DRAFT_861991 [Gymnopus androsaceus JB14]
MGIAVPSWKVLPPIILFLLFVRFSPLDFKLNSIRSFIFPPEDVSRFHLSPASHSSRSETTRIYNFTLAEDILSPNGVQKTVFTINGLFPGPSIEVRSGDLLVVNVYNQLSEGTSLHWHGIKHSSGRNSQDGASGVTQCPVLPGANFTYRIPISPDQSGTFWYHSHHSTQRADGLFGALIIHPPVKHEEESRPHQDELRGIKLTRRSREPFDVLDQVMLVGDWYHRSGRQVADWFQSLRSHGNEPVPDAVLNNGQQAFDCTKSLAKIVCDPKKGSTPMFVLDPQSRNVVRFINPGSIAEIHLSLDSHLLRVIEADGTQIQPVLVKELTIAPGQRYAVEIIRVNHDASRKFWLRQRVNYEDFKYPNAALDLESKSIMSYGSYRDSSPPSSQSWSSIAESEHLDALALQPLDPSARVLPSAEGVVMMYVTTMVRTSTGNRPFGYVNQTTWKPSLENPVLARAEAVSSSKELIVPIKPGNSSLRSVVMDIIVNNLEDGPHPFHLHGHHFWPLYTYEAPMGAGSYKWERPPTLPNTAPALRDTFVIPAKGHAVFRVKFDTPGMWLFHCHVLVHLHAGMGMIFDVMNDHLTAEDRMHAASTCMMSNE